MEETKMFLEGYGWIIIIIFPVVATMLLAELSNYVYTFYNDNKGVVWGFVVIGEFLLLMWMMSASFHYSDVPVRYEIEHTDVLYGLDNNTGLVIDGYVSGRRYHTYGRITSSTQPVFEYITDVGQGVGVKTYTGIVEIREDDTEQPRIVFKESVYEREGFKRWVFGVGRETHKVVPQAYVPVGTIMYGEFDVSLGNN